MGKNFYLAMAAAGALLWGINGVAANVLFDRVAISPDWLTTMRLFISGILILLYLLVTRQDIFSVWRSPRRAVQLLVFGLVGVYFAQSNFVRTLYYGNAAIATVLQYMAPAMIVVVMAIGRRVWPNRNEGLAVVMSVVGIVLLVTNGNLGALVVSKETLLFGILSAIGLVVYTLVPRSLLQTNNPLVVVGWGMFLGGFVANLYAPMTHVGVALDAVDWALLSFIVLFGSLAAFVLYLASLKKVRPETVGMLGMLEPVSATVLSAMLLGVKFEIWQVVGVVLTLVAIWLMNVGGPKKLDTDKVER
jgi:drug/metabolite transporter (DMT)-like permease